MAETTNNKAFLEELSGGKVAPLLPAEIIETLADKPDDEALFSFLANTLHVATLMGETVDFTASALASGLIDLGFKR